MLNLLFSSIESYSFFSHGKTSCTACLLRESDKWNFGKNDTLIDLEGHRGHFPWIHLNVKINFALYRAELSVDCPPRNVSALWLQLILSQPKKTWKKEIQLVVHVPCLNLVEEKLLLTGWSPSKESNTGHGTVSGDWCYVCYFWVKFVLIMSLKREIATEKRWKMASLYLYTYSLSFTNKWYNLQEKKSENDRIGHNIFVMGTLWHTFSIVNGRCCYLI